jgi:hypothetical protein
VARRGWAGGLLLALLSAAVVLTGLEVAFRFIARTTPGLADPLWYQRCWRQDETGYRVQPVSRGSRRTVIVVGDSFAAGLGICDPRDRFADQLAARLDRAHPGEFKVFLIADRGLNTRQEWEHLQRFPHRPDVLVLSYYFNDIDDAAADAGLHVNYRLYTALPPWFAWVVQRSYLVNFAYWSLPNPELRAYRQHFLRAWSTATVVAQHLGELDAFFSLRVPVVLVIFPHLPDLELSARFVDQVAARARARGVHVIDVRDLVRDLPAIRRVVNASDSHASVVVHHRVGEALAAAVPRLAP